MAGAVLALCHYHTLPEWVEIVTLLTSGAKVRGPLLPLNKLGFI